MTKCDNTGIKAVYNYKNWSRKNVTSDITSSGLLRGIKIVYNYNNEDCVMTRGRTNVTSEITPSSFDLIIHSYNNVRLF